MQEAAEELRKEIMEEYDAKAVCDIAVSCDGTWQRRGFSSLNGAVTAISIESGKCLGYECLAKTCKACELWQCRKGTPEYENFLKDHNCVINHIGTAGAMEAAGVVRIFKKSVKNLQPRYTTYIGDGDSKGHLSVVQAQTYGPDKLPAKGECLGHIQKRVGTRLRKFKKEKGSEMLSDGKTLGGIGRLNEKWINKLQNYYGLAIRQNTTDLDAMRRAVGAVLYHCSEAKSSMARHMFCDKESEWCKMRAAEKTGLPFQEKPGLPVAVQEAIKPIFQDLSKPELLQKCLHGHTQNSNEAINQFLWRHIPKTVFVGFYTFEIGMCSAVLNFNSGASGLLRVFNSLKIKPGYFTETYCNKQDGKRIKKMECKMSTEGKRDRKRKRHIPKGFQVSHEETEGDVYGSGVF